MKTIKIVEKTIILERRSMIEFTGKEINKLVKELGYNDSLLLYFEDGFYMKVSFGDGKRSFPGLSGADEYEYFEVEEMSEPHPLINKYLSRRKITGTEPVKYDYVSCYTLDELLQGKKLNLKLTTYNNLSRQLEKEHPLV